MKNKLILSDVFIVKESRRFNVLVLINHHQESKNDDIKSFTIDSSLWIRLFFNFLHTVGSFSYLLPYIYIWK